MEILEKITGKRKPLVLEDHNFRVDSNGWKKITVDDCSYLENPEKDIWEFLDGDDVGEQLFTWDSAMRETKKAGKRMPNDEEFLEILKIKSDMPNLVFAGSYFYLTGSFGYRDSYASFWSSTESNRSYAWNRYLTSSLDAVFRNTTYYKAHGFSVRCIKK